MRVKRIICMVLACVAIVGAVSVPASAAEIEITALEYFTDKLIAPFATRSFNMSIPAKSKVIANSSFPLAAWETVTIKASYSPFSASVDFGLVDSQGTFYYFNVTDGSVDKTIQVEESGDYTLQIRNNSTVEVKVSGFVNY